MEIIWNFVQIQRKIIWNVTKFLRIFYGYFKQILQKFWRSYLDILRFFKSRMLKRSLMWFFLKEFFMECFKISVCYNKLSRLRKKSQGEFQNGKIGNLKNFYSLLKRNLSSSADFMRQFCAFFVMLVRKLRNIFLKL